MGAFRVGCVAVLVVGPALAPGIAQRAAPAAAARQALVDDWLTDVAPKRTEPRLTERQKFIREEEQNLIEYLRQQQLPSFELQERQSAWCSCTARASNRRT